ncbi:hypothetical protein [Halorubellus salinus]|uniref:hypothetical protein n=1 Tax=Halorubellus salinus TaxID=755309 RepID=UPI001D05D6E1|nr:hypothetical protein [Halorubellus salinus]
MNGKASDARGQPGARTGEFGTTRRALLAAGGTLALGGLAGCTALDDVVGRASQEAVANRSASPAAFYTGGDVDDRTVYRSGPVDVRFVPPTLQAEGQAIDLDGWSTTTTTRAQNHNSSRSNRTQGVWVPDPVDEDDDNDGILTLLTVLDMERALLVYADGALDAVDGRSSADATAALDAFVDGTTAVRAALDRCSSETCVSVAAHADNREQLARRARDAVTAGEWEAASRSMQEARRIVQGDIEAISDDLDSDDDGDGIPGRLDALYDYLDGEATVGEHFAVSLPDARLRGDGPALADELTPRRVLEYFVGERGTETCGESDRTVAIHRDLACRDLLTSTLELETGVGLGDLRDIDKKDVRRGVAAFSTSGGVVVTGASPAVEDVEPMALASLAGCTSPTLCCDVLESWGEETGSGEADVSGTVVVPVAATPPDCPCPMPALFYVQRIRHDDQLLFVGGWHVDDGALYEDAATLLVAEGPPVIWPMTPSEVEDGGVDVESLSGRRKRPGRAKYGNITLKKSYDPTDEFLPAGAHPVCRDDGERSYWAVQSREGLAKHETGVCPSNGEGTDHGWGGNYVALDAPVLHLTGAASASNDVKFKAGAELSKAVN